MNEIEKGIPIPPKVSAKSKTGNMELLRAMEIGDSFVSDKKSGYFCTPARIAGIKITTRKIEDGKIRVWRFA